MTQEFDQTPEPAQVEQLRLEVARLEQELVAAATRHASDIERIKGSTRYRVGSAVTSLSRASGWKQLPGELRGLWRDQRRKRRAIVEQVHRDVSPRSPISADCVFDEFSQRALEHELTLRPVGRGARPGRHGPAAFIAESAWLGNGGQWRYQFSNFEAHNDLDRTISRYRTSDTPTIFWNKEDPAHFETFLEVARRFDHVFTTDADCVERYRRELGHDRVGTLPFAAQPALHNPMDRRVDPRSICFAGAWRGDVHPQRIGQLTTLLDAALAVGDLTIYARRPADGRADFPDRYRASIVGEIPYDAMIDEYRRHACFLNVNTVTSSPTMLSRRVFEILACRTPVVSAPSPAIERFFDGAVPMPSSIGDATTILAELVADPIRRDRLGQQGYRIVMSSHTYQHRVATICAEVGLDGFPDPTLPTVDAVVEVPAFADVTRALATVEPIRAGLGDLVVVCRDGRADSAPEIETRDGVTIVQAADACPPAEILSRLPGQGAFVALLDAEARYGASVIGDTMSATRFADADLYGKSSSHAGDDAGVWPIGDGHEFRFTSDVIDGTAVVRRELLNRARTAGRPSGSVAAAVTATATSRFAVDRFNHVAGPVHTDPRHDPARPIADAFC